MTIERTVVAETDRWNVEALYSSFAVWEEDFAKWTTGFDQFASFKGRLGDFRELKKLLDLLLSIDRQLSKLMTYAHLRSDEDVANTACKSAYERIVTKVYEFGQVCSWIEPEILSLAPSQLEAMLKEPLLEPYWIYLKKIIRMKPYTLSGREEELLALAAKSQESVSEAFRSFNNADLRFIPAVNSRGEKSELTHGKYLANMRSQDRTLRESSFRNYHQGFLAYENTLCSLLSGVVEKHNFLRRARGYGSCLEAALFPHQIDTKVYTNLIQTVRANLPTLHRYLALRKKLLKVDELHCYDLHVPIVKAVDMRFDYPAAQTLVIDSTAPLLEGYQKALKKGLLQDRWVDRFENMRKRSGAYSSGCYDSMPYILMNYNGTLGDVFTLAHEAGHSMHSYLSNQKQRYHDASYPIFVAEVASTFNEDLLMRHLLERAKSKEEKCFLLNQKIDDIRATFFRQTMFAEFELKIHEWVERGVPLTPELLKNSYLALNAEYYGKELILDPEIAIEWARVPHFYTNFYVYQYATGISAALALVEKLLKEGDKAKESYLTFLSSGGSKYPLELLRIAGVDMLSGDSVASVCRRFDSLVQEFSSLME